MDTSGWYERKTCELAAQHCITVQCWVLPSAVSRLLQNPSNFEVSTACGPELHCGADTERWSATDHRALHEAAGLAGLVAFLFCTSAVQVEALQLLLRPALRGRKPPPHLSNGSVRALTVAGHVSLIGRKTFLSSCCSLRATSGSGIWPSFPARPSARQQHFRDCKPVSALSSWKVGALSGNVVRATVKGPA